ncbi:hypothetical protein DXG01_008984 [Tephrocybe rancida]|nr:hypothetical protein DXG01_008984 [Tephrocybe rancida]
MRRSFKCNSGTFAPRILARRQLSTTMAEWIDVKAEDTFANFLPSDSSGTEPNLYFPAAEAPPGGQGVSLPPDPEQVFHGRPAATPSERQRTVQACDKCRERKTKVRDQKFEREAISLRLASKCSGEHPVCQRCTTRGLICQYSSREPRTRGPSKARLRNAVSSADLRSSPNPNPYSQLRHYNSQTYDTSPNNRSLRRVASIPSSLQVGEHRDLPLEPVAFDTMRESYTQSFAFGENSTSYHAPPPLQYTQSDPRMSQLRDMRRVQSHSTLIGSHGGRLNKNTPSYPSFHSPNDFPGQVSYGQHWVSQAGTSPPPIPAFDTANHLLSPGPRVEQALQPRLSPKVHPWGYYSDESTGSDPMSNDINIEYSPASSEDAPEPQSCSVTFMNYSRYSDTDVGLNMQMPSQNDCAPQFLSPSVFTPGEHFTSQGVAIPRPSSDSDMHVNYEQYY